MEQKIDEITPNRTLFANTVIRKLRKIMKVELLHEETTRMAERIVVLRISTKHLNLWIRQLEMKRKEIGELAGLLSFYGVKEEVENEKNLEKLAKRYTHYFTKMTKRTLFEETDNMVWNGGESEIASWCRRNKVLDEIT